MVDGGTQSEYPAEESTLPSRPHATTWRLCLMAMLLRDEFPEVDFSRLIRICIVHDLGEAIGGDISAPEQARRLAEAPEASKTGQERTDLLTLLTPLPPAQREEIAELWMSTRPRPHRKLGSRRRSTSSRRSCNTRRDRIRRASTTASISTMGGSTPEGMT